MNPPARTAPGRRSSCPGARRDEPCGMFTEFDATALPRRTPEFHLAPPDEDRLDDARRQEHEAQDPADVLSLILFTSVLRYGYLRTPFSAARTPGGSTLASRAKWLWRVRRNDVAP